VLVDNPLIEAHDLAAGYGERVTWSQASFAIGRGEFVGVLGPNGAGTTTLFRLLLGLMRPLDGELRAFGEPIKRGNPRIGYVPQRRPVDPDMNIEALELVLLGLHGHKYGLPLPKQLAADRARAMEALLLVDAGPLAHRPLGGLSGGELQRVFLAQALVGKPDVLLLDEPLANLDIRRETNLVQLVNEVVQKQGVTALLIAHNLNPLLPVLDRILYVAKGRVLSGTPEEVITSKTLSKLYDAPVEVLRDSHGRVAVLGIEEASHPHA
jgi:zinc/manganese transport system ATP-binding protein